MKGQYTPHFAAGVEVLADKLQPALPSPFALNHQQFSFEPRKVCMEELQIGQSDDIFFVRVKCMTSFCSNPVWDIYGQNSY